MNPPIYPNRPIGNIKVLSKSLGISQALLADIIECSDKFYRANEPIIKAGGGIRQTYSVRQPLERLQKRIVHQIFQAVQFPEYLLGSIKGRDYIASASLHTGRYYLFSEDVSNFFPSIQAAHVHRMWQHFFHFSHDVASALTTLTTYNGSVPQGASTSSYIANLIFWDYEPQLEQELRMRGFIYSRFVDDITYSVDRYVGAKEKEVITSSIYKMLYRIGVRPNRQKRNISQNNSRQTVHNLNVNGQRPSLSPKKRNKIRNRVYRCEQLAKEDRVSEVYRKLYMSVRGQAVVMKRLHPNQGDKLLKRLALIKPL